MCAGGEPPEVRKAMERGLARARSRHLASFALLALLSASSLVGTIFVRPAHVSAQDDALTTASVVPETALVYFAVNLDLDSAQWQQGEELLRRAGFDAALMDLEESIVEGLAAEFPGVIDDLDPFLGGEVAVVVTDAVITELMEQGAFGPPDRAVATPDADLASPQATPVADRDQSGVALIYRPGDVDTVWTTIQQLLEDEVGADQPIEST